VGQLRPGIGLKQAQAELDTIAQRMRHDNATLLASGWSLPLSGTADKICSSGVYALLGALALVLLIACANVRLIY